MSIVTDLQKLSGGAWVELFELDASDVGGTLYRFHCGTNEYYQPVVWQGQTYTPWEIQADGFGYSGTGAPPRPKLRASNVTGILSALLKETGDLLGAKLTRKRTMVKFLDAVNFIKSNYLLWSEDLTKATWFKVNVSASAAGTALSTGAALSSIVENTVTNVHYAQQVVGAIAPLTTYRVSVICKALGTGSGRRLRLRVIDNSVFLGDIVFDLAAGVQTTTPNANRVVESLGNGEYRISVIVTTSAAATSLTCGLYLWNGALASYAGDGVSGALVTEMQLYEGSAARSYQKTGASHNPTADPLSALPDEIFYVVQKTAENRLIIELELGTASDLTGAGIPKQSVLLNCRFRYRGNGCGYAGGPVADYYDQPTTDPAKDACSHKTSGCKLRFGANADLPFGGFPGAGMAQRY